MIRHPQGLPESLARLDRTLVMGILNVTPDSFSDGGRYLDPDAAVAHGRALVAAGADLIDVGGESTRPGAVDVPSNHELSRVRAVVADLVQAGVPVSIDTRHADVARACVAEGAVMVNDVSAGRGDPHMWPFIAESGVPYVLMHNRGTGPSRPDLAQYDDAVREVMAELDARISGAVDAGLDPDTLVVDLGLGFAKTAAQNWALVAEPALAQAGRPHPLTGLPLPFMVGASRKRFLGAHEDGSPRSDDSMAQRDILTVEITRRAVASGAWAVRVHQAQPNANAIADVVQAVTTATKQPHRSLRTPDADLPATSSEEPSR